MSPRKLHTCAEPQQPRRPPLPLPELVALKAPHSPGGAFAFLRLRLRVLPTGDSTRPASFKCASMGSVEVSARLNANRSHSPCGTPGRVPFAAPSPFCGNLQVHRASYRGYSANYSLYIAIAELSFILNKPYFDFFVTAWSYNEAATMLSTCWLSSSLLRRNNLLTRGRENWRGEAT
jgi:hypothetical protein